MVRFLNGWNSYEENRRLAGSNVLKRARKKMKKLQRDFQDISFEPFIRDDDAFQKLLKWNRVQHEETHTTDVLSRAWIRYVVEAVYNETGKYFGGELFLIRVDGELAAGLFCIRAGQTFTPGLSDTIINSMRIRRASCYSSKRFVQLQRLTITN